MSRRLILASAAVLLSLLLPSVSFGFVMFGSVDRPESAHQQFWPEGLRELVRQPGFIVGKTTSAPTWGHGMETAVLYYSSDAAVLNAFLKGYAQLDAPPLVIYLRPEAPEGVEFARVTSAPGERLRSVKETKNCNWNIIVSGSVRPEAKWNGAVLTPAGWDVHVSVNVWLGGSMDLEQLEIPPGMKLIAAGKIAAFIRRYEAQQQQRSRPTPSAN